MQSFCFSNDGGDSTPDPAVLFTLNSNNNVDSTPQINSVNLLLQ